MRFYQLFIGLVLWLVSCNQSDNTLTKEEKAKIEEEIIVMLNNYANDVRKSGLTAEFSYLDSSEDFFWIPPGYSSAISFDSVAVILKTNAPVFSMVDNDYEFLKIIPVKRKIATYYARIRSSVTDTSGKVSQYSLFESGVLIKRDGNWKLLSGQTSLIR